MPAHNMAQECSAFSTGEKVIFTSSYKPYRSPTFEVCTDGEKGFFSFSFFFFLQIAL